MLTRSIVLMMSIMVLGPTSAQAQCPNINACESPTCQHVLISGHCAALKPSRIVIVVSHNRKGRLAEQDLLAKALAKHVRSCGQISAVVSRERICQSKLPMQRGTFEETELLDLARTYNADAVLYCELNQLTAFQPMRLELSCLLVDVGEAVALVSTSCSFDLRDAKTYCAYTAYAGDENKPITQIFQHSPSTFIDFASSRVARTLLSAWKE